MKLYRIDIEPTGGFYTPIKGDTLFGALCWAIVECFGDRRLAELLNGYADGEPFAVVSDAFPAGHLPKPVLPFPYFKQVGDKTEPDAKERKKFKKREWVPAEKIGLPTNEMAKYFTESAFFQKRLKTANRVNPETNHADGGAYSAYMIEEIRYAETLNVYAVIDENRISAEEIKALFKQIGQVGFGKKASSGGGKFTVSEMTPVAFENSGATAFMTLAPCVPAPDEFNAAKSFYKVFVRFGRHGNVAATSGKPFKQPVMTMDAGAVLTPKNGMDKSTLFVGTGVKGASLIDDRTVFQGYAPVVALTAKETK